MSVFSVLVTLVLFSELSSRWVTVATPAKTIEDNRTEQDGLGLMLNDKPISEPAFSFLTQRRSIGLDNNIRDDKGTPQIIVLSDMRTKGQGMNGFTLLTDRNSGRLPEYSMKIDRRDTDLDMLRCMIGRVYRPCWEV